MSTYHVDFFNKPNHGGSKKKAKQLWKTIMFLKLVFSTRKSWKMSVIEYYNKLLHQILHHLSNITSKNLFKQIFIVVKVL